MATFLEPIGDVTYLPRININHADGTLSFNDEVVHRDVQREIIVLGLVQQRAMSKSKEKFSEIVCKSIDFREGKPLPGFPWEDSNFTEEDGSSGMECAACPFSHWTTVPGSPRGSGAPRCTERFVLPTLVANEFGLLRLGVLTLQKSSVKPAREYLKAFSKLGKPSYFYRTDLRLNVNLGSNFKYTTPDFRRGEITPETWLPELSLALAKAKSFLSQPIEPRPKTGGGLLSVSDEAPVKTSYSGSFFS